MGIQVSGSRFQVLDSDEVDKIDIEKHLSSKQAVDNIVDKSNLSSRQKYLSSGQNSTCRVDKNLSSRQEVDKLNLSSRQVQNQKSKIKNQIYHFCLDKQGLSTESFSDITKRYKFLTARRIITCD